jgi:hypothetical protein
MTRVRLRTAFSETANLSRKALVSRTGSAWSTPLEWGVGPCAVVLRPLAGATGAARVSALLFCESFGFLAAWLRPTHRNHFLFTPQNRLAALNTGLPALLTDAQQRLTKRQTMTDDDYEVPHTWRLSVEITYETDQFLCHSLQDRAKEIVEQLCYVIRETSFWPEAIQLDLEALDNKPCTHPTISFTAKDFEEFDC